MANKIVILEDNAERKAAMRACIADRFYTFDTYFFDEVAEMIAFLKKNLAKILVISLDNDLDMKSGLNGGMIDVGEGRQVADYLAMQTPVCPVIIHTSNSNAAVAMEEVLRDSGWKTRRVLPFDDTKWIQESWFFAMRRALVGPIKRIRTENVS